MQVTSGRAAVADENNLTAFEAAAEILRVVRRNIYKFFWCSVYLSIFAGGGASPSVMVFDR